MVDQSNDLSDLVRFRPAIGSLLKDDKTVLYSGVNAGASSDIGYSVVIGTKTVTNNNTGIDKIGEAAGMHRVTLVLPGKKIV